MPRGPVRTGQKYKFHRCDTGCLYKVNPQEKKKKCSRSPLLNRVLGGFWKEEIQADITESVFTCEESGPVSQEHVLSQKHLLGEVHSVHFRGNCIQQLLLSGCQHSASTELLGTAPTLCSVVPSVSGSGSPAFSQGGKHQQPQGLGRRGQIAAAKEATLAIHCSCLHSKRVRQDWEGRAYTPPACKKG